MKVAEAQRDMRRAYVGGGPGACVSAFIWFAAAIVEASHGIAPAFGVLFFGGMLIFPLSTLACRFLFGRKKESGTNPMGLTALESTIAMIGGLFAAWLFLSYAPAYAFPLAAIAVGTHYLVFRTVYGDITYWLLAAVISCIGLIDIFKAFPIPAGMIFAVGFVELLFGVILVKRAWNTP